MPSRSEKQRKEEGFDETFAEPSLRSGVETELRLPRAFVRSLEGHTGPVFGVAMSRDGRLAVSASYDKTLKVWDVESGRELRTLEGHTSFVYGVALSGDGRLAVSASSDKTLKVWDVESGRELRTLEGHTVCCHWRGAEWGRAAGGLRIF